MADGKLTPYDQIYTLGVKPGIKRDGTVFEAREFSDGVWCRFQRGVPKKIGGYRQMFGSFRGIARGLIMNAYNGVNYIFEGNKAGIDVFTTNTDFGSGSGPFAAIIEPWFAEKTVASTSGDTITITSGTEDLSIAYPPGTKVIFGTTYPLTVYTVVTSSYSNPTTTVQVDDTIAGSPSSVWIYNDTTPPNNKNLWQFDMQYSPYGGSLEVLAHPGLNLTHIDNAIDSQVLYGNMLPNSNQEWTFKPLADTGGSNPTYAPISVSGGVCVLYPYIFVYGNNGLIANNHVAAVYGDQQIDDWNGPTANRVNMAAGKIVKGMPMRGGTNSPSGLFWATDSLIRVSFTGNAEQYWKYDIISSQISIMSSNSIVEMDGAFFWMGVDRFYVYNGQVAVLPNDKNVNWLFDNLNYSQRQKVWATKVPRFNEIWFFYPRGQSEECNDAIIYNVKDKLWYDAGQASGAHRSCGYTTEVFPSPIWAEWEFDAYFSQPYSVVDTPEGETPPEANQFYLSGNVTSEFAPGTRITLTNVATQTMTTYLITASENIYNDTIGTPGVTLITVENDFDDPLAIGSYVYIIRGGYGIYQHEYGLNYISLYKETAIPSSFTTCDMSWVGGTPSEDTATGMNRRLHLRRVEPDFVQSGPMTMTVIGRKFAQSAEAQDSGPFVFNPDTEKIDLRVEDREVRLKFESNVLDGNYEMGRILITAEPGDERP